MTTPAASDLSIENGVINIVQKLVPLIGDQKVIYEVFRIDQGKALFLDDHLARLYAGIDNFNYHFTTPIDILKSKLSLLIQRSNVEIGNVKIEVYFCGNEKVEQCYRAFFIPTSYPDKEMYQNGVVCNFLNAIRENPSIKMANPKLRNISDQIINREHIHETILVNGDGLITEGSRSNLFFVKSGVIYTAPKHLVLEGIMREKVIQVIQTNNMPIEFTAINKNDIHLYDACFITGTSPRVLPVREIDGVKFNVPDAMTLKITEFLEGLIADYLSR